MYLSCANFPVIKVSYRMEHFRMKTVLLGSVPAQHDALMYIAYLFVIIHCIAVIVNKTTDKLHNVIFVLSFSRVSNILEQKFSYKQTERSCDSYVFSGES